MRIVMKPNFAPTEMSLEDKLREDALDTIRGISIVGDDCMVESWGQLERSFLNYCLNKDILSEHDLCTAIIKQLRKAGRGSYDEHLWHDEKSPHETQCPPAFAFAIRSGEFSEQELRKIRFDEGEDRYIFLKGVEANLVDLIRGSLYGDPKRQPPVVHEIPGGKK